MLQTDLCCKFQNTITMNCIS